MHRSIDPFIHRKVVVLHETDTASQAAKAMAAHGIGSVMVSDRQSHITGVVTDRDLAQRILAEGKEPNSRLREFMTVGVASINENASLDDAIDLMAQKGIRRIPVLREMSAGHQRCVGLITLDDLLVAEAIDSLSLKRIIKAQILRRLKVGRKGIETDSKSAQNFLRQVAQDLNASEDKAEEICRFVFGAIARRLNYSAAVQFILQLPLIFQFTLFNLPPGPDRSVTAHQIVEGITELLDIPSETLPAKLKKMWQELSNVGDKNQLDHVLAQLPHEIVDLFRAPSSLIKHDFEQWEGP